MMRSSETDYSCLVVAQRYGHIHLAALREQLEMSELQDLAVDLLAA